MQNLGAGMATDSVRLQSPESDTAPGKCCPLKTVLKLMCSGCVGLPFVSKLPTIRPGASKGYHAVNAYHTVLAMHIKSSLPGFPGLDFTPILTFHSAQDNTTKASAVQESMVVEKDAAADASNADRSTEVG